MKEKTAVPGELDPPEGERVRVSYYGPDGVRMFALTEVLREGKFALYAVGKKGGSEIWKKLGECASPIKLEERFRVFEKIEDRQ